MSIEANKQVVTKFWAAFSVSDFDTALTLLGEDLKWWVAGDFAISGTYSKKQFGDLVKGLLDDVPKGIRVTPQIMTAEEDRVAMVAESYGKRKNGKIYNNKYHILHFIRDGKIIEAREYMDTKHCNEILCS
ncbi:conserved protein of unknown function [Georgfuchsia toluolica]|uniref:SnoaL-like domain-containing protein n=1 Tax=Georgfuchsia toluolica TaxID=424218 RepID=A0A916J506_9PROT|nr:nuclear transport factor 2 family protein [Georgfuchsia toluolica]CAG4884794.1 conserved protein of unknown function [Georgfuchsia toluolica]